MIDEKKFLKIYGKEPTPYELRQARALYVKPFTFTKKELRELRKRMGRELFNSTTK